MATSLDYSYTTPATTGAPNIGVIVHADDDLNSLFIHRFDATTTDRTVLFADLTAGATIADGLGSWTVTGEAVFLPTPETPAVNGWVRVPVVPAVQQGPTGIRTFVVTLAGEGDVTLTPTEVLDLTGETVTQNHIDLAADQIKEYPPYLTPTEHRDDRSVPEASVKAGWAVASVNVRDSLVGGSSENDGVLSESQDDYSYSRSEAAARGTLKIIDSTVRRYLHIPEAVWTHI